MAQSINALPKSTELSTLQTEIESELVCTVCRLEGDMHTPVGYCKTCKDHLCATCFKGHKEMQSRGHVLLDKAKMPKDTMNVSENNTCLIHNFKALMYHCSKHNFLGCSDCNTEHSKTCQAVSFIPVISDNIASSRKFKDTRKMCASIASQAKNVSDGIRRKTETIDRCSRNTKAELDSFKLDLIQAIEEHVEQLKETIYTTENSEKAKLERMIDIYDTVQSKAEKIVHTLDSLKAENSSKELFMTLEKSSYELPALQYELASGNKDQCMKSFKYEANHDTLERIKKPFSLGGIRTSEISKVEHIGTIKVNVDGDKEVCAVNGLALMSEGKLVIADQNNKKVKMLDTASQEKVTEIGLSSKPWTVATLANTLFAVSLPEEGKIVLLRAGQTLTVERELTVNGKCRGLAYGNGLLVVSYFEPSKVELMDENGRVVRIIEYDSNGQKLFNAPDFVAMHTNDNVIYISNHSLNNVLCIDVEGNVLFTFKIQYPRQPVINESGQVLISEAIPPAIRTLEKDSKASAPFLSAKHGLAPISNICYDESTETLFVAELNSNHIKVFRMLYS